MSQFQPLYAPVYGSSPMAKVHCVPGLVSNTRRAEAGVIKTAGRVKITRKFSTGPRMSLTGRSAQSGKVILNDFHVVNKDFIGIFDEMANQLSQCKLSEADEAFRELFYGDLKEIRDLIVKVLAAHRQVAHIIRNLLDTSPQRGCLLDVRPRLTPAWESIRAVGNQLYLVSERLKTRDEEKKNSIPSEDAAFRALFEFLAEIKKPHIWGVVTGLGLASPIWSGIRTDPEEFKMLSTKIIQCLSNIGAIARFRGFVDQSGFDATLYKHDAFKTTGDCLVSVEDLTKQLGQILGSLEHSWRSWYSWDRANSEDRTTTTKTSSKEELLEIASMLDKHVEDCMVMASNIQRNFNVQEKLLSPVELYEERKWRSYGAEALRSCPKRAATFGAEALRSCPRRAATLASYVEQRVSKVHQVIRSRYMT